MTHFTECRDTTLILLKAAIATLEQPATFKGDVTVAESHVKQALSNLYDMRVIASKESTPNPISSNPDHLPTIGQQ